MSTTPIALTIAGSDSGGGAGIQADLKTFALRGVFGCSAITAITAQNTLGVFDIYQLPPHIITAQLHAVATDLTPSAVKIGMLGNGDTIKAVVDFLSTHRFDWVVLDPVMLAKDGNALLFDSAMAVLVDELIPKVDIITPNLSEATRLTGIAIYDDNSIKQAGDALLALGAKIAIIKGGHTQNSQSGECVDWIFTGDAIHHLSRPRYPSRHTHGTGCTFSACLTAELAKQQPLINACTIAKNFISEAIKHPIALGSGCGPVNHWAYQDPIAYQP